ncbi:excinuclease ABC subunit UvrA [Gimesia sp.]|uniref:excinuclease ABC subunit UvrA n=1 Tax=Gimesia sp. TaxID=2024833 RepID=UPI003A9403A8
MRYQNDQMIRIRGARCHNLKNIDVDLPRNQISIVTGVSGSGKSSLVFDTIHQEGQRRFLENLSPGTRQLFSQAQPVAVDQILGLPPTICFDQTQRVQSKRSTLATLTELYDFFRLLYAKLGIVHCVNCGQELHQQTPEQIVDLVLALEDRKKVMILAPVVSAKKGNHSTLFHQIAKEGFVRARIDGAVIDVTQPHEFPENVPHDIEIVIDRIIVKEGIQSRLKESVDLALKQGGGTCLVSQQTEEGWSDRYVSTRLACGQCNLSFPDPEPVTFSFNSPYGACATCNGLGVIEQTDSEADQICPQCQGARISQYGRSILLNQHSIDQVIRLTAPEIMTWLDQWESVAAQGLSHQDQVIADQIVPSIRKRLDYLTEIGLGYIQLSRPSKTLSGGELQRARLAACLGAGTTGACYILDEPTAGLHTNETQKLLTILQRLKQAGNSIIVVEHDHDVMRAGDYLIDIGPGAGTEGGNLVFSGDYEEFIQHQESITVQGLTGSIPYRSETDRTNANRDQFLQLTGASINNLKAVTLKVPLRQLVCVTGVSGSGKSSLIIETLVPAIKAELNRRPSPVLQYDSLLGVEHLQQIKIIDQTALGKNGRSNPATYCGIWDEVRKLFSKTKTARLRGYTARRFSFNSSDGRCGACRGTGVKRIDLKFLPPVFLSCEKCHSKRFNQGTLAVRYRGKTVSDVLEMSILEAWGFFESIPRIRNVLQVMLDLGLGYLALGQPANLLSGGEAQRIRLASELISPLNGRSLFVLDEPTRGLHSHDINCLLRTLDELINTGNSVLVIEHHPQVMFAADWIIDLGPESGTAGGSIIDEGPPAEIAANRQGATGKLLYELIDNIECDTIQKSS